MSISSSAIVINIIGIFSACLDKQTTNKTELNEKASIYYTMMNQTIHLPCRLPGCPRTPPINYTSYDVCHEISILIGRCYVPKMSSVS